MSASSPTGGPRNPGDPSQERSAPRFRGTALASGLIDEATLKAAETEVARVASTNADPVAFDKAVAALLVERRQLTRFQADQMLAGRRKLTLGQYRIIDAIGQGGMGQVFRAEHAMMGRVVAIKVLPRAKSTPDTEAAFQREIRMLGRLDHENLVRALDAGNDGKVYYLVTEYVPGVDLRKQVLRYGTLDEVTAASVITQAARGLAYAHEQGLVHRDVKPGNLLVTEDGRVKVLDLGLAGSVLEAESTRLGRVVGTMDYMAPEQIRSADTAGPAADIYGLGCTLYFALAGQVPFPGGTRQEKARRQLSESPPPVRQFAPHVSDAFGAVLGKMMEKSPQRRIATAEEVIERLRPWTPESSPTMSRIPSPRHRRPGPSAAVPAPLPGSSGGFGHGGSGRGLPSDSQESSLASSAADGDSWPTAQLSGRHPAGDPAVGNRGWSFTVQSVLQWLAGLTRRSALLPLLWLSARILVVATLVGFAFGTAIDLVSGLNPRIARELLGENGSGPLGRQAFVLMLVVQCLAAFTGRGGRGDGRPGRR